MGPPAPRAGRQKWDLPGRPPRACGTRAAGGGTRTEKPAGTLPGTARPPRTCLGSPARPRTLSPRLPLPAAPWAPTHQSHWVSAGAPRHPAPQRWRPATMRPCWSADLPAVLVTATAPLCNQGIHSRFYPASASFFPPERLPRSPSGLLHRTPSPGGHGGRGLSGLEPRGSGVRSPSAGTHWVPHSPPPPPFWESSSREAGGLGQGSLECFPWLLTSFTLRGARAVPDCTGRRV